MRKILTLVIAFSFALALVGCAPSISGTPSQVLEECQSVPADQQPTVEVTGYVVSMGVSQLDSGSWSFELSDRSSDFPTMGKVTCFFDNEPSVRAGQRVTVVGTVGGLITPEGVSIFHCSLKTR